MVGAIHSETRRCRLRLLRAVFVVLVGFTGAASRAAAADADAPAPAPADAKTDPVAAPPAGQAGMKAYFDPQTGKVGGPPRQAGPPAEPGSVAEQRARSTSAQGLKVVPAPGGGHMVDLQGRFQSTITATLKPDGTVDTDCHPHESTPPEATGK